MAYTLKKFDIDERSLEAAILGLLTCDAGGTFRYRLNAPTADDEVHESLTFFDSLGNQVVEINVIQPQHTQSPYVFDCNVTET